MPKLTPYVPQPTENLSGGPERDGDGKAVAILAAGELFGGVERQILALHSGLQALAVRSVVLLFYDRELASRARSIGADTIILPNKNISLIPTSWHLARLLKDRKIRVIHVHGYKAMVFAAVASQWHKLRIIKTEHGLTETKAVGRLESLRERFYRNLDVSFSRMMNASICYVTDDLRDRYWHAHAALSTKVIRNGIEAIDRARLKRPQCLSEESFNLLIVGRLDAVKGHQFAIEAIAALKNFADIHLYVLGEGPCLEELERETYAQELVDRIHFLGFREDVYNYIQFCDALLIPSLHEGLPYVLLEAMSIGAPVIASNIGGLAETLEHNRTALLFPAGNAGALANAILRLHGSPSLRSYLTSNAREFQVKHLSRESMARHYLAAYNELL